MHERNSKHLAIGKEDGEKDKDSKTSEGRCSTILFMLILTEVITVHKEI
jgi:hypothetical protein